MLFFIYGVIDSDDNNIFRNGKVQLWGKVG